MVFRSPLSYGIGLCSTGVASQSRCAPSSDHPEFVGNAVGTHGRDVFALVCVAQTFFDVGNGRLKILRFHFQFSSAPLARVSSWLRFARSNRVQVANYWRASLHNSLICSCVVSKTALAALYASCAVSRVAGSWVAELAFSSFHCTSDLKSHSRSSIDRLTFCFSRSILLIAIL